MPRRPTHAVCQQCDLEFLVARDGPVPKYCSAACRTRRSRVSAQATGKADEWERRRLKRQAIEREARRVEREVSARPCPYCETPMPNPRRVQCGAPDCQREHNNARRREFHARYRAEHGHWQSRRYPENPERKRQRDREREAEMPSRQRYKESNQARDQRRRARKQGASVEYFTAREVYERDGWVCQICSEPVDRNAVWPHPKSVSLDHVIPLSRGGRHSRANTQCSHWECNHKKRDLVPV